MILASHQPDFFPYMGYFYKVWKCDKFIFSDNVQFSKSGRHNYNDILAQNGRQRFTLPVRQRMVNLNEIQIAADERKISEMAKTLRQNYQKAEHFGEVFPTLEELLYKASKADSLAEFNIECITTICKLMGMERPFERSSDIPMVERRDARIIKLCEISGANAYYSGAGAKDYHIEQDYANAGVDLMYSDYVPAEYQQVHSRKNNDFRFEPNLSVIDYVMNCGFKNPWEV